MWIVVIGNGGVLQPNSVNNRQEILLAVNRICSTLDRVTFFQEIASILRRVFSYDRVELAILDTSRNVIRIYDLVEEPQLRDGIPVGTEFPFENSIQRRVIETQQPLIYQDLEVEVRCPEGSVYQQIGLRSAILVPLRRNGSGLGTLDIGSIKPNQYSAGDAEVLMEIANQISLPVENILAHEEIRRLRARLEYEYLHPAEEIQLHHRFTSVVGQSLVMRRVLKAVETVAPTDAGVLLCGETGTGKELIVRAIHELSPRKDGPLIKVNCAALPRTAGSSVFFTTYQRKRTHRRICKPDPERARFAGTTSLFPKEASRQNGCLVHLLWQQNRPCRNSRGLVRIAGAELP